MSIEAPRFTTTLLILILVTSIIGGDSAIYVRAVPQAVVTVGDSFYSPQEVTIVVGSTVLWKNTGTLSHTATSDSGLWNSGPIPPGGSYQSPVFSSVGIFNYHSSLDSSQMTGKVIVDPTTARTLYSGTVDEGLLAGYIITILFAVVAIFWLNYPSSRAKARARVR